jgi:predicted ArsR family transcriptional regulator
MAIVTGYTIQGIADELGIPYNTARMRIDRLGLEPITDGKIFPLEALDAVRNIKTGRPKKPLIPPSANADT